MNISRVNELNNLRIKTLHPVMYRMMVRFIHRCSHDLNFIVFVTSALRSFDEQAEIYSYGRYGMYAAKRRRTNAKAGQSYHNYGLAADYIPLKVVGNSQYSLTWDDEEFLGPAFNSTRDLAKRMGFELISWDRPHLQYSGGWKYGDLMNAGYGTRKSISTIPLNFPSEDSDEEDLPITV